MPMKTLPITITAAGASKVVKKRVVLVIVSASSGYDIERSVMSKGLFLGPILENPAPTAAITLDRRSVTILICCN